MIFQKCLPCHCYLLLLSSSIYWWEIILAMSLRFNYVLRIFWSLCSNKFHLERSAREQWLRFCLKLHSYAFKPVLFLQDTCLCIMVRIKIECLHWFHIITDPISKPNNKRHTGSHILGVSNGILIGCVLQLVSIIIRLKAGSL